MCRKQNVDKIHYSLSFRVNRDRLRKSMCASNCNIYIKSNNQLRESSAVHQYRDTHTAAAHPRTSAIENGSKSNILAHEGCPSWRRSFRMTSVERSIIVSACRAFGHGDVPRSQRHVWHTHTHTTKQYTDTVTRDTKRLIIKSSTDAVAAYTQFVTVTIRHTILSLRCLVASVACVCVCGFCRRFVYLFFCRSLHSTIRVVVSH